MDNRDEYGYGWNDKGARFHALKSGSRGDWSGNPTRLPVEIWFQEKATASDMKFELDILNLVKPQTLILLDRGFCHYQFWQQLIEQNVHLITRLNNKASFTVEILFTNSYSIRDRTVKMGAGTKTIPWITMRLVEIRVGKTWYSYLTSVLDPLILPLCRSSKRFSYRSYQIFCSSRK